MIVCMVLLTGMTMLLVNCPLGDEGVAAEVLL
jgi:hypothetical protein